MSEVQIALQSFKNRLLQRWNQSLQDHFKKMVPALTSHVLEGQDRFRPQVSKAVPSLFPDGTRYFWEEEKEAMIVFEEKPKVRTVSFKPDERSGERYKLAFPYVVHVAVFDREDARWRIKNLHVHYANSPLNSLNDPVYMANLPNINPEGKACISQFAVPLTENICEIVLAWVRYFWSSNFTSDWSSNFKGHPENPRLSTTEAWQNATEEDPFFVLGVEWKGKISLREVMGKLWGTLPSANRAYNLMKHEFEQMTKTCWVEMADTLTGPETAKLETELLEALTRTLKEGR